MSVTQPQFPPAHTSSHAGMHLLQLELHHEPVEVALLVPRFEGLEDVAPHRLGDMIYVLRLDDRLEEQCRGMERSEQQQRAHREDPLETTIDHPRT